MNQLSKLEMIWLKQVVQKFNAFSLAMAASILVIIYWSVIASDRYVSEAHVMVQSTDIASGKSLDFSSVFGDVGARG